MRAQFAGTCQLARHYVYIGKLRVLKDMAESNERTPIENFPDWGKTTDT